MGVPHSLRFLPASGRQAKGAGFDFVFPLSRDKHRGQTRLLRLAAVAQTLVCAHFPFNLPTVAPRSVDSPPLGPPDPRRPCICDRTARSAAAARAPAFPPKC